MTFTALKCEFCAAELKTKSSFNQHQRINKKCIEIQEQKNINTESIFTCEFCEKNFTSKQSQNKHYEICKINKISKDNIKKDTEIEKLLDASKDIENSLKEKDEYILKLEKQVKESKNNIKDKEYILKLEKQVKQLQNNIKDIVLNSL